MSKLAAQNGANGWGANRGTAMDKAKAMKDERKNYLAKAGELAMTLGSSMNNRITSSERQSRPLGNNLAADYLSKKPATMKYGQSMMNHNEEDVSQASSALRLLKSKMSNTPSGNKYERGYYDEETHGYNQYAPGPKAMGQDQDYNSMYGNPNQGNYRQTFKPEFNEDAYGSRNVNSNAGGKAKVQALNRVNNYGDQYSSTTTPTYSKPPMGGNSKNNQYGQDDYSNYGAKNVPSRVPAKNGKVNQPVTPNYYDEPTNYNSYSTKNSDNKSSNLVNYNNKGPQSNRGNAYGEEDQSQFSKPVFKKQPPTKAQPTQQQQQPQVDDMPIKAKGKNTNDFDLALQEGGEFEDDTGPLKECPQGCGRSFNPKALARHAKVCKKVFLTKRKEFDSSKARETDEMTDLQREQRYNGKKGSKAPPAKAAAAANSKKQDWKKQSENFRANLKAARGSELTKEEAAAQNDNSHLVSCDYCGRKFNANAAERHIPFCQSKAKVNNIKGKPGKR